MRDGWIVIYDAFVSNKLLSLVSFTTMQVALRMSNIIPPSSLVYTVNA